MLADNIRYNIFRWYRSGFARYSQADPIDLMDGPNLFAYVGGNPRGYADPDGLARCSYSIVGHALSCYSNDRKRRASTRNVFSGRDGCRDTPSEKCIEDRDDGPVPPGDYKINPDTRSGHDMWRRLEPDPPVPGWMYRARLKRAGFALHLGTVSLGCITMRDRKDAERIFALIDSDPPSTLTVIK